MNEAGDKMVTKSKRKRANPCGRRAGAFLNVKSGSAAVPIYRTESNGRVRFALCFYREGRRERKIFTSLEAAKKEALFVARRIQSGIPHRIQPEVVICQR